MTTTNAFAGLLAGLAATHWPESWRWFGVGVEGLFLDTPVRTRRGRDVAQTRSVMLVDLLGRHRIGSGGVFVYAGPTGGFAYTTVRRGGDAAGPGVGALSGVAVPLIPNLRLRFEVQYLVTHDVDSARTHQDRVDVSGNRRNNPANAIFGPHLDTQFLPLRVGLDWVFRRARTFNYGASGTSRGTRAKLDWKTNDRPWGSARRRLPPGA